MTGGGAPGSPGAAPVQLLNDLDTLLCCSDSRFLELLPLILKLGIRPGTRLTKESQGRCFGLAAGTNTRILTARAPQRVASSMITASS